ncbi:MAG: TerB family tellurite resistance protein [Planctomycetes bacterium]|nr:TerB family tellurite resistance protein [Planctomycetota bacterium]
MPEDRAATDPSRNLTAQEKRAYLMALITLAASDRGVAPEEAKIIREAARRLNFRLTSRDIRTYDLDSIVRSVTRPSVRSALFSDLLRLAQADRRWAPEELRIIRYLSEQWAQPLPAIPGLDWNQLTAPTPAELERISDGRRDLLQSNPDAIRSADPGMQWLWVVVSAVLYVVLACVCSFAYYFYRGGELSSKGDVGALGVWLFIGLMTGLLVGMVSPGRTVREAAIGTLLGTVALLLAALQFVRVEAGQGSSVVVALILMAALSYLAALSGSWYGEAMQGKSQVWN